MLAGATITLVVTGSIAAYKSAELVRELVKLGVRVRVIMTGAAGEFITPLTLQTLSGSPVTTDLFDPSSESEIGHITLADFTNLVLVAPATADLIAKAAAGTADNAATAVLLATKAPIVIAPAMNVNMWRNPLTQRNVEVLKAHGARFVEPDEGDLACGWVGPGRLAPLDSIIDACQAALHPQDLAGCKVVVTAGPTREAIDPVRFLTNGASGKMGHALARVARWRGAEVFLVTGPTALHLPAGVHTQYVDSAEQMRDAVVSLVSSRENQPRRQLVFMAAAVSDHRPKQISATKLKKDKQSGYAIELEPAPDILLELSTRRNEWEKQSGTELCLIGFALETASNEEALLAAAKEKLRGKGADLFVGNTVESLGKDTNNVWLIDRNGGQEEIATADKHFVAEKIIQAALAL